MPPALRLSPTDCQQLSTVYCNVMYYIACDLQSPGSKQTRANLHRRRPGKRAEQRQEGRCLSPCLEGLAWREQGVRCQGRRGAELATGAGWCLYCAQGAPSCADPAFAIRPRARHHPSMQPRQSGTQPSSGASQSSAREGREPAGQPQMHATMAGATPCLQLSTANGRKLPSSLAGSAAMVVGAGAVSGSQ